MDSSDSDAPGDSDVDDSAENNPGPGKKKMSRFSVAQNACLNAYYSSGMRGIGKKYSSQIVQAASDSQLTTLQVIRWIKKKGYRKRHARLQAKDVPVARRPKLTAWQLYLKEFGETSAGKQAMSSGAGAFNKAASALYSNIPVARKKRLKDLATHSGSSIEMSVKDILKAGARAFKKIQHQFEELEKIGYSGFAFGFFDTDVQEVHTTDCDFCVSPKIADYFRCLTVAGHPLPSVESDLKRPPHPSSAEASHCSSSAGASIYPPSAQASPSAGISTHPPSAKAPPRPHQQNNPLVPHQQGSPLAPPSAKAPPCPPSAKAPPRPPSAGISTHPSAKAFPHPSSAKVFHRPPLAKIPSSAFPSQESLIALLSQPPFPTSVSPSVTSPPPVTSLSPSALPSLSSSPVKGMDNIWWIPHLNLSMDDKAILISKRWLNDSIVYSAQKLLSKQVGGAIHGWQSTQCCKRPNLFSTIPYKSAFIQILNVGDIHWITVSNILAEGRHFNDVVYLFDSMRSSKVTPTIKKQICSFMRPSVDELEVLIVDVGLQPNNFDCGVYAIATATEIALGYDPALCVWEHSCMRDHLISCLEEERMTRFPVVERRCLRLGKRVRRVSKVIPQCICRMPSEKKRDDIECTMCQKWFHMDCMLLDPEKTYDDIKWVCSDCEKCLQQ